MGVDYTGNYGLGVKIHEPENLEEKWDGDIYEWIEHIQEAFEKRNIAFEYFQVGNENYSGISDEYYFCIEEPFILGEYQKDKVDAFMKALKELDIDYEDGLDIVGGLRIY